MRDSARIRLVPCLLAGLLALASGAASAGSSDVPAGAARDGDLTALSLEELMAVEVTSVSKKDERLGDAPAAIYVITQEDIHRSGARSVPEALRMAPGVHVAHIDANTWAVSTRGLNGRLANKLLVLLDGRSVYTPLFGGVFWDVQNVLLEDVDRIEVIRGPGATVWGANAVNGVINIITKPASETQGGLVSAGAGTHERLFGAVRWGGAIGDDAHYRVWAQGFDREPFVDEEGDEADDEWDVEQVGFRLDWTLGDSDALTLHGDLYTGDASQSVPDIFVRGVADELARRVESHRDLFGGYLLGRFTRQLSEDSDLQLQAYYDRTERADYFFEEDRDTFDLDFQHHFAHGRHDVVWGAGYRLTRDRFERRNVLAMDDVHRSDHLYSAFLQDEIELARDRLWLTLGSKVEHNSYTGWELQPSGRLLWKPEERHTFWGAVSRAVRTPARADEDVEIDFTRAVPPPAGLSIPLPPQTIPNPFFPGGPPLTVQPPPFVPTEDVPLTVRLRGDEDFQSTVLNAFELGYRFMPQDDFWLDLALYYNDYGRLEPSAIGGDPRLVVEPGPTPTGDPVALRLEQDLRLGTKLDGHLYGGELAFGWRVTDAWRLTGSYSYLNAEIDPDTSLMDPEAGSDLEGSSPSHMFHLRSYLDLPYDLQLDGSFWWIGNLARADVPSYTRFDLRLAWRPRPDLELSLVGQNLFERSHREFGLAQGIFATEAPRSVYGQVRWRF